MRRTNRKSTETPPAAAPEVAAAELARYTLIRLLARQAVTDFLGKTELAPDVAAPSVRPCANSKKGVLE